MPEAVGAIACYALFSTLVHAIAMMVTLPVVL